MKKLSFPLACILLSILAGAQPKNGEPLMAGGPDGLAPLSLERNIQGYPMGFAHMSGGKDVDLVLFAPSGLDTGMWLCERDGADVDGHPVYRKVSRLTNPWGSKPGNAMVFEDGKDVWLVRMKRNSITLARWDGDDSFVESAQKEIKGLSGSVSSFSVIRRDKRTLEIAFAVSDGQVYRPDFLSKNTMSLYDGAGSYRGNFPKCGLFRLFVDNDWNQVGNVEQISHGMDVIMSPSSVSQIADIGYVITNNLGAMKFLPYSGKMPRNGVDADYLRLSDGSVFTFRNHGAKAVSVPAEDGRRTRLLIGGECSFFVCDAVPTPAGATLRYGESRVVLERHAPLYGGSLTVPNVVDWDGDGVLDIVAGNSEARILFFKNHGTDAVPDFRLGEELQAAGQPILLRPGYYVTQGPFEGAWGYVAPTVYDWNGDGLPDIVTSGSKAKYEVFLNVGTRNEPCLAAPFAIHCDAMELHGVWRVRPAIAEIEGHTYIMIQDDANALHLYRRVDDRNVEDCGRVHLENGDEISGHNGDPNEALGYGQWGRAKMRFCDWDGDGDMDILLGCIKRASFPRPQTGLPYRRFKQKKVGMQVLYFENTGNNTLKGMKFAEPRQIQIDGNDVPLGAHSNAPEPCLLGDASHGMNLLVGCESGKYYFYQRDHITYVE